MDIADIVQGEIKRIGREFSEARGETERDIAAARTLAFEAKEYGDIQVKAAERRLEAKVDTKLNAIRKELDAVSAVLNRTPRGLGDAPADRDTPEVKAFGAYLRHGLDGLEPGERKSLMVSGDPQGGFLAPSTMADGIQRLVLEFSPIRQLANAISIGTGTLDLPKVASGPAATWTGELQTHVATDSSFKVQSIDLHELSCYIDLTQRFLEDSSFAVEQLIASMLGEAFAIAESAALVTGNGIKKPLGLLNLPNGWLPSVPTGAATDLKADALFDALYGLKQVYQSSATWLMNRRTAASIRKMKDGNGRYLWDEAPSGLTNGMAATLLGRPVSLCPDMPDVAADATPIVVGDFKRGMTVLNKVGASGITILRDPYSLAGSGQVRLHARLRSGGAVTRSEAFNAVRVALT